MTVAKCKSVIVADDNLEMRERIVKCVKSSAAYATIKEVKDGNALVREVKKGGYALVLTDQKMPNMTGLEAVRAIRKFNPTIPIYLISGIGLETVATAFGATGYIKKDDVDEKLPAVIGKYLTQ